MIIFFILISLKVGASCSVPAGFEHLGDDSNDYYKMDSVDRDFFASASNCAGLGGTLVGPTSRDRWDAMFSHFEGETNHRASSITQTIRPLSGTRRCTRSTWTTSSPSVFALLPILTMTTAVTPHGHEGDLQDHVPGK